MLRGIITNTTLYGHHVGVITRAVLLRNLSGLIKPQHVQQEAAPEKTPDLVEKVRRLTAGTDIEDILNRKHQLLPYKGIAEEGAVLPLSRLSEHYRSVTTTCEELLGKLEECAPEEIVCVLDDLVAEIVTLNNVALFLAQSIGTKRSEGLELLKLTESYLADLNSKTVIMESLTRVIDDAELWAKIPEEDKRVAVMLLRDCKNNGLNLSPEKHKAVQKHITQVTKEGVQFVKGAVTPARLPVSECPDTLLHLDVQGDDVVVRDWCDTSHSDSIRQTGWCEYYRYDEKKERRLHGLLAARHRLATSTGYSSYTERVLQGTMAGSPRAVSEFLNEVHTQVRPCAREEMYEIEKFKYHGSKFWYNRGWKAPVVGEVVVFPWDTQFVAEEMRQLWIRQETTRFYPSIPDFLSVGSVIEQIGVWLEDTFGVTLVAEVPLQGELWHSDVIKLAVEHEKEGLLGFLYLDFYQREARRGPPCNHVLKAGSAKQLPVAVLECCYSPGNGYRPPHLDISTLEKLFRELGGAVGSMLGRNARYHASSHYLSPDVGMVTGYLLQNMARNPALLFHVMKHHTRTRVFPRPSADAVCAMTNAQNQVRAHEVESSVMLSVLDQQLHSGRRGGSSTDLYGRCLEEYTHLPYVEGTAPQLRFTPLFTQGGHVYSHLWCKAIAAILYEELFVLDPFSRHAGEYLREHLLQHGAGREPREMVEYLTGTKLTPDRMASALVKPIEGSQNYGQGFQVMSSSSGPQWWHRDISSPDSPLLGRLASSHPHLLEPSGELKVAEPFNKDNVKQLRDEGVNRTNKHRLLT